MDCKTKWRAAVCPKCGGKYVGRPAVSRRDASMHICPDCGIREALESLRVCEAEQDRILELIHCYEG